MIVHPHAEIVDAGFCRQGQRGAERARCRAWWAARARRTSRSIAWWEGVVSCRPGHASLHRSTAAASCPPTRGPAPAGRRRGRHGRRLSARALALGGPQRALRRGRWCSATASTSTICLQVRAAGRKVDDRRRRADPAPLARARRTTWSSGSRRTSPIGPEVGGPDARAGADADGRLEGAAPVEPRPSARPRGRSPTPSDWPSTPASRSSNARSSEATDTLLVARSPSRCARSTCRRERRRARALERERRSSATQSSSARRRISSRETTDCSGATPARTRSCESRSATRERARVEQAPQHRLLAGLALLERPRARRAGRARRAMCSTRLASRRSSSGLRSQGSRIARRRPPTGRRGARPRRSRRTPARPPAAARSSLATKSSTAVSTPLRGAALVGRRAG